MSVNPLDRTDEKLIHLVNDLGDPVVDTQTVAEEIDLGFQQTLERLQMLEEQDWIDGQADDGQQVWQVASKANLLVRTESTLSTVTQTDPDIIEAQSTEGGEDGEGGEQGKG